MSHTNSSLEASVTTEWILLHPHWTKYPHLTRLQHQILAAVGIFIFFFSLAGNVTVIFLFIRFRSLRSFSSLFVLNLTIADLLLSVGNIPMLITSSFYEGWVFGITGCRLYAFIGSTASFVSINTLTAIAMDRCLVIIKNLPLHNQMSRKQFGFTLTFIWFYSIIWSAVPFFGWGRYILEGSTTSCTFDFLSQTTNVRLYVFSIFTAHFLIPVSVIICSYTLIFVAIFKHKREFAIATRVFGEEELPLRMRKSYSGLSNEAKTARVSIIVILIFCLSWLPYATVALVGIAGNSSGITPLVATIPCFCAKFSTVVNPVIYALLHPKFRLKITYYGLCGRFNNSQELSRPLQVRSFRLASISRKASTSV